MTVSGDMVILIRKHFNPAKLDCEQWVKTFVAAGMKGVILTAKHHDGFCLWPTGLTEYCIEILLIKMGKGILSVSCRRHVKSMALNSLFIFSMG